MNERLIALRSTSNGDEVSVNSLIFLHTDRISRDCVEKFQWKNWKLFWMAGNDIVCSMARTLF